MFALTVKLEIVTIQGALEEEGEEGTGVSVTTNGTPGNNSEKKGGGDKFLLSYLQ